MNEEATEITLLVVQALDKLEIPYLIAGSVRCMDWRDQPLTQICLQILN